MSMKFAPLLFGFALFLSSSLLFVIQPVLARTMLPHLGGNPLAWNTCLVFFQATLLAGYIYAGLLHRFRGLRWQPWLQLGLMAAAVTLLFTGVCGDSLVLDLAPRLTFDSMPILSTFALLSVAIGFPYLVLAAAGPLLQRWFAHLEHPRASDPYFLFVAGNLGGLTALVLYPLLIEPNSVLRGQWLAWILALSGLGVLLFLTAFFVWRSPRNPELEPNEDPNAPAVPLLIGRGPATWPRRWYWLAAAGLPVALTMGATDYLTLDVAPVPLLWALPLALYLFAFSQAFARVAPFQFGGPIFQIATPTVYGFALLFFGGGLQFYLAGRPHDPDCEVVFGVITFALLLFMPSVWLPFTQPLGVVALVYVQVIFHGESGLASGRMLLMLGCCYLSMRLCLERLADERPAATALTTYFTWIGLGGLLGGLVQLLVVPLVFRWGYVEFAVFAAFAGMFRPAWLRNGLLDWIAGQVFFPNREGAATSAEPPAKGSFALLFDFAIPAFVAVALIGLFLTRTTLQPGDFDPPMMCALLFAVILIARPVRYGLALVAIVCFSWIGQHLTDRVIFVQRSHFGILQVVERKVRADLPADQFNGRLRERRLIQGTTQHGCCVMDPAWRRHPTSYYHRKGPIGHVLRKLDSFDEGPNPRGGLQPAGGVPVIDNAKGDLRVAASLIGLGASPLGAGLAPTLDAGALWSERPIALVGLGAGTLFNYAHPTQWVDAYELDPAIIALSEGAMLPCFHDATERCVNARLIVGDARRNLSKPGRDRFYRVIVVDAFMSGAIPVHLLTMEAVDLYFEKLTRDGVICIHTSNRYLDLPKALDPVARKLEVAMTVLDTTHVKEDEPAPTAQASQWVVLARNQATLQQWTDGFIFKDNRPIPAGRPGAARKLLWTDEHASLKSVVKRDQHWATMIQAMLIVILLWGGMMGVVELIPSLQSRSVKPS